MLRFVAAVLRFVFTDTKGMLYYFKTADDPPNYRGMIDIKCAQPWNRGTGLLHSDI